MTPERLLGELGRRGVRVWADDGRLCYEGPQEVLTAGVLKAMRRHKAALLNLLQDRPPYWPLEAWQPQWGWVAVRDPFTGQVHELRWRDCPEWLRRRAQGEPGQQTA